jgi:hypothetical protein
MRGILLLTGLFDGDRPVLTYIPLPAEKVCITDRRGYPHYAPEYFCDVVVCSGDLIKFVELDFEDPGCRDNGKSWRATTWSRKVSWDDWRKHRTVDVSEISVDPSYSALLPGLVVDDERQELQLKKLYFLNPTLSVRDDHIFFICSPRWTRETTRHGYLLFKWNMRLCRHSSRFLPESPAPLPCSVHASSPSITSHQVW